MTYISSLSLNHFRNYDAAHISDLDKGFVVLIGENGTGKTNCLEAISLLSPGRGLRGAGVAVITAYQDGSANYLPATEVNDATDVPPRGPVRCSHTALEPQPWATT